MKKFFSLVLALVMALSLTTVAWGADIDSMAELNAAIAAANDGDTITLTGNIADATSIITINKAITLDGGNFTLTSTAGRAINIETTGTVEIKNLTVNASGERAFNVINQPATLKLTNVTATAANYTVNIAATAGAAKVTITDSTLTGLNTVNVASAGAVVTISGGKIVCDDQSDTEYYAALSLNSVATGATITVSGTDFDIKGNSILASNPAEDAVITIDGSDSGVTVMVAEIKYGAYSYIFPTVQDAIDHAVNKDGASATTPVEIIVLDAAVNSGESFTPAAGVTVTLPAGANTVVSGGKVILAAPTSAAGTTTTLKAADKYDIYGITGTTSVKAAGADITKKVTDNVSVTADGKTTVTYTATTYSDGVNVYVEVDSSIASYKLVKDNTIVAYMVNLADLGNVPTTTKVATAFVEAKKTADQKCGDFTVDGIVVDGKTYIAGGANWAVLNGKFVTYTEILVPTVAHDYAAGSYNVKDKSVATVKCVDCKATWTVLTEKQIKTMSPKAYTMLTTGTAEVIGLYIPVTATAAAGTTTGTVVESAQTFDAGIAMYVGMSVMAAAGSAVVLKKKD